MKHPTDIFKIAAQCNVRLLRPKDSRQARRPRECFAKKTLKRIGQRHGEAHLALVIRLVVETDGNATELSRETLVAISALLASNPALADRGGALFDQFDRIDLGDVKRQARALACGMSVSQVMRVLLALRLYGGGEVGLRSREGRAA